MDENNFVTVSANGESKRLFWFPGYSPDRRLGVFLAGEMEAAVRDVKGAAPPVELDLSQLAHGERWTDGYSPSSSAMP